MCYIQVSPHIPVPCLSVLHTGISSHTCGMSKCTTYRYLLTYLCQGKVCYIQVSLHISVPCLSVHTTYRPLLTYSICAMSRCTTYKYLLTYSTCAMSKCATYIQASPHISVPCLSVLHTGISSHTCAMSKCATYRYILTYLCHV